MSLPNLVSITGQFGSGKTLYAVQLAVAMANAHRKPLIVNFPLNESILRDYCRWAGLRWFASCGRIIYRNLMEYPIDKFIDRRGVFVLDEAGAFLNSRDWAKLSPEFRARLFQLRRIDAHLFIVYQFEGQIDRQLSACIQKYIDCRSIAFYDRKLRLPRCHFRIALYFSPDKWEVRQSSVKRRVNWVWNFLDASPIYWSIPALNWLLAEIRQLFLILLSPFFPLKVPPFAPYLEGYLFRFFNSAELLAVRSDARLFYPSPFAQYLYQSGQIRGDFMSRESAQTLESA